MIFANQVASVSVCCPARSLSNENLSMSETHVHTNTSCCLPREMYISEMDHPPVHLDGATLGTGAVVCLHPDKKHITIL